MLKTGWLLFIRNTLQNKGLNAINIFGLAIGMIAFLLIYQYLRFEKSYDKHLDNSDRLYRLVFYRYYETGLDVSVGNNYRVGQLAFEKVPDIEAFCRCRKETQLFQVNERLFKEERTFFADSSFFDIFSYHVVAGSKSEFLRVPDVAIITESLAKKYFGPADPIGKSIYTHPDKKAITIQGVVKDVPENSHLKFDIVISLSTITDKNYCYSCNNTNTYFRLKENTHIKTVESKLDNIAQTYFAENDIKINFPIAYQLQKITDIHLNSNYRFEHDVNGSNKYQSILMVIALFILISAGLNYYNLYVSLTEGRLKSIGSRMITGASRRNIIAEFTTEAFLTGLVSLILAFMLLYISFPLIKNYLNLNLDFASIIRFKAWLFPALALLLLSLIIGMLLGLRFFKLSPVNVLKNNKVVGSKRYSYKLLLTSQFVIAIILVAGTIGVMKQIHYMQKEAFSMEIDQTLVLRIPSTKELNQTQVSFREELRKVPGINDITFSTIIPGEKNSWVKGGIYLSGKESAFTLQIYQSNVASNFFKFFDVTLLAGRHFLPDETNWTTENRHVILNKEAATALSPDNLNALIGKSLYDPDNKSNIGEIVGIIDGYFQNSLDQEIRPTIFNCDQLGRFLFIRMNPSQIKETLEEIKSKFQEYYAGQYWDYFFLDDFFNNQYQLHIQFNRSVILFSMMAMIISALSLLGLSIMISWRRTKEIGIRKVNGSSIIEIMTMLNRDFIKWVAIAFVIACPIVWYAMHKWLENFAYKTTLSWWVFAAAGGIAMIIALVTVSWQSWRAATRNPVESLRYE